MVAVSARTACWDLVGCMTEWTDNAWCRMFNQQELQILLGGVDTPIDLDDLRKHTQYGGLYDDHHLTIQLFWQVRICCIVTLNARRDVDNADARDIRRSSTHSRRKSGGSC